MHHPIALRRIAVCLVVATTAVFLGGGSCISQGLFPLYTKETRAADPGVVGKWTQLDEKGKPSDLKAVVEQDGTDLSYVATLTTKNEKFPIIFRLVFVDLDGVRYADVVREPILTAPEAKEYADWVVPTHGYARVEKKDDKLKLSFLSDKWESGGVVVTQTQVTARDAKTNTSTTQTVSVIANDTASLQALVKKAPASAFNSVLELQRVGARAVSVPAVPK